MHETLLLGIAASELTVLLTSDPRRWSRRLVLFVTLIIGVMLYSWLVLGVSTFANVTGTVLAFVWFGWDLVDGSARGVLTRWALATIGFVALLTVEPGEYPALSLLDVRPLDLIIAITFMALGPANHLITAILMCARGRATDPVPGWINAPVLPPMPADTDQLDGGSARVAAPEGDGAQVEDDEDSLPLASSSGADTDVAIAEEEGPALRGGRWIGPLERLLVIVLVGAGADVAIGAVVAAKGVIRFPEISQDSTGEKAEEFLIGSISSWILAALVALFVRVALQTFG